MKERLKELREIKKEVKQSPVLVYSTASECPLCGTIMEKREEVDTLGVTGRQWVCSYCDYQEYYEGE